MFTNSGGEDMTKFVPLIAIALILGIYFRAGPVEAQTFVSGSAGNDVNNCSFSAPCATLDHAFSVTSAGGEIDVLDDSVYPEQLSLHISHAVTIAGVGAGTPTISTGTAFAAVSISAPSTDKVIFRRLNFSAPTSGAGIVFSSGASLVVDHCTMQGFQQPALWFQPGYPAKLEVIDSTFVNNGDSTHASILIAPQDTASATVQFDTVRILQAIGNGIRADGTAGGGAIDIELHNVTIDGGTATGIVAISLGGAGGPAVDIVADGLTSSHNNGYGVRAYGGTARVTLTRSTISNNVVGLGESFGGVIISYGNNSVVGNSSGNGAPTSVVTPD
jgi:hypothetical protein